MQDDEIFERARLVNCGFFMQIILRDYIGAVLHLVQDGQKWRLNPLEVSLSYSHTKPSASKTDVDLFSSRETLIMNSGLLGRVTRYR